VPSACPLLLYGLVLYKPGDEVALSVVNNPALPAVKLLLMHKLNKRQLCWNCNCCTCSVSRLTRSGPVLCVCRFQTSIQEDLHLQNSAAAQPSMMSVRLQTAITARLEHKLLLAVTVNVLDSYEALLTAGC
jgi:hypothetical protein